MGAQKSVYIAPIGVNPNSRTPDYFSFDLMQGEHLTLALKGAENLELTLCDSDGELQSTGSMGPTNIDRLISDFSAQCDGTFYAKVTSLDSSAYRLLALRNAVFDLEPNDEFLSAQLLSGDSTLLGSVNSTVVDPNVDLFGIDLAVGDTLRAYTMTPADGEGEFANDLDPLLALWDPSEVFIQIR